MQPFIYAFSEGNAKMRETLGGKGANLAEMTRLGFPVPKGFTITTHACLDYLSHLEETGEDHLKSELTEQIDKAITHLEETSHKKFSDSKNLLLVSVRSGAPESMPGMMDTILNAGLNDQNVNILAKITQDERFAYDCYRRLLQMYGNVVYEMDSQLFEDILKQEKTQAQVKFDYELDLQALKRIVEAFKELYLKELGFPFPQEVKIQLTDAIKAVFKSWNNHRAKVYRRINHISDQLGTAVNIQEMVFGNSGTTSGTGVLFTRNPATGENKLFGEYLKNAQGEDVVAGIRTPSVIEDLKTEMPEIYSQIHTLAHQLESYYHNMQDIEFTIEKGKLFFLQTRNGKRTAKAAVKIAVDMVQEGLISKEEAILQVDPEMLHQLLHPTFAPQSLKEATLLSAAGLAASPGAASGEIVFTADQAKAWTEAGKKVILVRNETSPEDIEGMHAAAAILTCHGGMTSHAAVVARGMGKCCVSGCSDFSVNEKEKTLLTPQGILHEGDLISVDGSTGRVYLGQVATTPAISDESYQTLMTWAKEKSRLTVRMNAETPTDIQTGFKFEAKGIGLVRTEHMFFKPERLREIRRFILSASDEERQQALDTIRDYQAEDFEQIFKLCQNAPAVIRLLDPPLHEFLPHSDEEIQQVATDQNISTKEVRTRLHQLQEVNPMLGHRGCRLAITFPNLYDMQVEAILKGALVVKEKGLTPQVEIMIPLVGLKEELHPIRTRLELLIQNFLKQHQVTIPYIIGTMIEIPRACFISDQLAKEADFFSFGTNDLTQMTFGFSRDDAGKFINQYLEQGVLKRDPFQTLDKEGVGRLIQIACEKARPANPNLKIGVCGELGGDPDSIAFFDEICLDYVSCSPYRVPVAQLAAAQSAIRLAQ